ncbi:MAG: hypothetical protein GY795_09155 [Desulfobacterales bacterium]|nr:hypothetical protein [Desulfobacterales bacterium]
MSIIKSEIHKHFKSIPNVKLGVSRLFIPVAVFLIGIICFISDSFCLFDFPLDDAWIHQVYSQSFAFGHGFQYNDGIQEAGSTSPLWAIVTSPAHWFGIWGDEIVVTTVKAIGILLGVIAVLLLQKIVEISADSKKIAVIAASLFALEPRLLFSSLSGMETNLLLALFLSGTYAFLKQKWFVAVILFSMMPVTRPEAAVMLPVCILGLFICGRKQVPFVKQLIMSVVIWIPLLCWSVFCKFANGHWLPNTYYLKAQAFTFDIRKLYSGWEAVSGHGYASLFIFYIGTGVYLLWCYNNKYYMPMLFIISAPLIYFLAVSGSRQIINDGYYWTRWIDPASLVLTACFCIGWAVILTGDIGFVSDRNIILFLVIIPGVIGILLSVPSFVKSFNNKRDHLASDSRAVNLINVRTGQWINRNTPPDATVAVNDAGAVRYFGKRHTIDLIGLNNHDIAFRKVSRNKVLKNTDWIAVFPGLFRNTNLYQNIINAFKPRAVFHIPLEEYTVCNCPSQTIKVIFEKKNRNGQ